MELRCLSPDVWVLEDVEHDRVALGSGANRLADMLPSNAATRGLSPHLDAHSELKITNQCDQQRSVMNC